MSKILYISDTHFEHRNIIRLNNRPFDNIEEMNKSFVENWNRVVDKDDEVIHGGDFVFNNERMAKKVLKELKGKIILVKGNHDGCILKNKELRQRFEGIYDLLELNDSGKKVVVCHYPMLEWNGMYRGSTLMYGHIHNNVENDTFGLMRANRGDNAFNIGCDILGYEPCTYEEVIKRNKAFNKIH